MATDYSKRKNDELAALCKERKLAHTGKKADLVKRLEEYDAAQNAATAPAEDEIDWDDEPAATAAAAAATSTNAAPAPTNLTSAPAANALAAGGVGAVPTPAAVPNQVAAIDPSNTADLTVESAPAGIAEEPKKEDKDFTAGIADRTLEEEIEKRKARARKFGMPEDSDEIKSLERARRFGTADVPGMLNKALSEATDRKRGSDTEGDGGIRKRGKMGRGRGGRGGRGGRKEGGRDRAEGAASTRGHPGWMSEKDREAAARRKAKFATTS